MAEMVVLLDTNVIFDVLTKRQPFYSASNNIDSNGLSKTFSWG